MRENKFRLHVRSATVFTAAFLLCAVTLLPADSRGARPAAAQAKPLTKAEVKFVHHDKVKSPAGQVKTVSSPYVRLFANTTYYVLVGFGRGAQDNPAGRYVALYKWSGGSNTDCYENMCWSLLKKYSPASEGRPIEDELRFDEETRLLVTSWPMGVSENDPCSVEPTTQGEGLKFVFRLETDDSVRIAKTPLRLSR